MIHHGTDKQVTPPNIEGTRAARPRQSYRWVRRRTSRTKRIYARSGHPEAFDWRQTGIPADRTADEEERKEKLKPPRRNPGSRATRLFEAAARPNHNAARLQEHCIMAKRNFTPVEPVPESESCRPELADFIIERNRTALAAGLVIEKLELRDGRLTTWYCGTEQQWRATPFCVRRADRPFTKTSSGANDFWCFFTCVFLWKERFATLS
jgi:hypothetical protein